MLDKFLQYNRVDEEVLNRTTQVEQVIQSLDGQVAPTPRADRRRQKIYDFIARIVQEALGCSVCPTGSFAQKTYLPDGDIDITIVGTVESSWCLELNHALCARALTESSDGTFRSFSR